MITQHRWPGFERGPAVVARSSAKPDFEAKVVYAFEEGCVCVLLVVMLWGLLFTVVSFALIARAILGITVDRVYSWAVNSTRGELFSVPASVDTKHGGQHWGLGTSQFNGSEAGRQGAISTISRSL